MWNGLILRSRRPSRRWGSNILTTKWISGRDSGGNHDDTCLSPEEGDGTTVAPEQANCSPLEDILERHKPAPGSHPMRTGKQDPPQVKDTHPKHIELQDLPQVEDTQRKHTEGHTLAAEAAGTPLAGTVADWDTSPKGFPNGKAVVTF